MKWVIFILLFFYSQQAFSQYKYWIYLKDKGNSTIDLTLFDKRTIEKRKKLNIEWNELDKDINQHYIHEIIPFVDSLGYSSRWLNAIAVYCFDSIKIQTIKRLPFVNHVSPINSYSFISQHQTQEKENLFELLKFQTGRLEGNVFKSKNLNGQNVRIAVIDAGFSGIDNNDYFKHLFQKNKIIKTWDFIHNKENVYHSSTHGTMVMSCITGKNDTLQIGMATESEFLLAISEYVWSDTKKDEDRWIAALEWAELNGADIVNSSVGYTEAFHFPWHLNGKSPISRAANIAASKGVLVINSAGNELNNLWKMIILPGDADSVLTVGSTDPYSDLQASFSSKGPTADGRIKPNVCAPGICVVNDGKKLIIAKGTSFSSPLITGFAACLLQFFENKKNAVELKNQIENSAHLFPYYDYAHGFGIPQAGFIINKTHPKKTFQLVYENSSFKIIPFPGMIENHNDYKLLYYHIESRSGQLNHYGVYEINQPGEINLNISTRQSNFGRSEILLNSGEILRVHFEGHTEEFIYNP